MTEEPKLSPKIERMLATQTVAGAVITLLCTVLAFTYVVIPLGLHFLSFVIGLLTAYAASRILCTLTIRFLQIIFYQGDYDALLKDSILAQEHFRQKVIREQAHKWGDEDAKFVILKTSERIGSYDDLPIFDWIEIMGRDGHPYHFKFHGTRDSRLENPKPIPADCIMYKPGIIYQVVTKIVPSINTVA